MNTVTMPATEAETDANALEQMHYELAFHVLPTVAEGEVSSVVEMLKGLIKTAGSELTIAEAPERIDLAYEIDKMIEGKHRRFTSAYFGWLRFKLPAVAIPALAADMSGQASLLRHLLIKLTKTEVLNPFYFHESLKNEKLVTSVEESEVVPDITTTKSAEDFSAPKSETEVKEVGEVSQSALDESLGKITNDNLTSAPNKT